MLDQRLRFVLHQQVDGIDLRIDQIAKNEVDDAVPSPKGHRRFRALGGKWIQAATLASCHNESEYRFTGNHIDSFSKSLRYRKRLNSPSIGMRPKTGRFSSS